MLLSLHQQKQTEMETKTKTIVNHIKVVNEAFGVLVNETFTNATQFKLFIKTIQASLELKTDFTFFNGSDSLVHIPYRFLVDSIILTSNTPYSLSEHMKSKFEALVTKDEKK